MCFSSILFSNALVCGVKVLHMLAQYHGNIARSEKYISRFGILMIKKKKKTN